MLYRFISFLLFPLWLIHGWRHGKRRGNANYLTLRLARNLPQVSQPLTWLHAASVGEVEAITPLANHYLKAGKSLLITSFTASGLATIKKNFGDRVISSVIPIDSPGPCERFFDHFTITHGLILETELWPQLLRTARLRDIPVVLANARLSAKTYGNRLVRSILSGTTKDLAKILCRNPSDKDHFLLLGANPTAIEVIGNLKAAPREPVHHQPIIERPYLLLASSHEPEEAEFLQHRPGNRSLPLLVIVPRHPERSSSLQDMMKSLRLTFAVRSLGQLPDKNTEVYLADTLGELTAFMQYATVVLMGGSFEGTGGHNLHEPARLGCCIVTGPSDSNIKDDISWLQRDQGIKQVTSMEQAWQVIQALLGNPTAARALGDHARQRSVSEGDLLSSYIKAIDDVFDKKTNQA